MQTAADQFGGPIYELVSFDVNSGENNIFDLNQRDDWGVGVGWSSPAVTNSHVCLADCFGVACMERLECSP